MRRVRNKIKVRPLGSCQILFLLALVGLITGCGNSVFFPSELNSGQDFDTVEVQSFSETLFPLLEANCGSCHGASQSPVFADARDIQSSFEALRIDTSTYINRATPRNSPLVTKVLRGHQCWSGSCSDDAAALTQAIEAWVAVIGSGDSEITGLATTTQTIPDLNTGEKTLSFDLSGLNPAEVPGGARIEISIDQLDENQYVIGNPKIFSSQDLQITAMSVYVNSKRTEAFAWEALSLVVSAEPDNGNAFAQNISNAIFAPIGYGKGVEEPQGPGVDTLTLSFEFIGEPFSEQEIRFNAAYTLMQEECSNCHISAKATGFGEPVQAFIGFSSEQDFLNKQYGTYLNGDPRFLVVPGNAQASGLWRSIAHHAIDNPLEEYQDEESADRNRGNPQFLNTMVGVGDEGQRAQWSQIIGDWIDGMQP